MKDIIKFAGRPPKAQEGFSGWVVDTELDQICEPSGLVLCPLSIGPRVAICKLQSIKSSTEHTASGAIYLKLFVGKQRHAFLVIKVRLTVQLSKVLYSTDLNN